MSPPPRIAATRLIVAVLTIVFAIGCTKTVNVPLDQLARGSRDVKKPHHIYMVDGSEYSVRQFVVHDTTLTIQKLSPSDPRYKNATLPIVLPLRGVKSVEKSEPPIGGFVFIALVGLLCVVAFAPIELVGD